MAFLDAFGRTGGWLSRGLPPDELVSAAQELERSGYGTVWVSGGGEPGVFDVVETVLSGTARITVATGIVNLWVESPASVTDAFHRLEQQHPGRLYVGLGISHAPMVNTKTEHTYSKPLARTREFLDELDAAADPVPAHRRLLGALGPKMLELARTRTLGTHPYLVTVQNTAAARSGVGEGFVAPELGVVLDPDLDRARASGRKAIERYFALPNYTNNWLRSGFTEKDLAAGGSDQLIDEVLALGDVEAISARVQAHRDAGADHVTLQILGPVAHSPEAFRELAVLLG
jgi:probable F420-dependent oxidoreductase